VRRCIGEDRTWMGTNEDAVFRDECSRAWFGSQLFVEFDSISAIYRGTRIAATQVRRCGGIYHSSVGPSVGSSSLHSHPLTHTLIDSLTTTLPSASSFEVGASLNFVG